MIEYYFDNIPLCRFKGWTESWTGLFDDLTMKEPVRVDYPDQHGYRHDRSNIRYKELVITLTLVFSTDCRREIIRDDMKRFREILSKNRPIRLKRVDMENNRTDVWDVDLFSSGTTKWYDDQMAQKTLTFHETAPVKAVYKCTEQTSSVKASGKYTLLIRWGDGTEETLKNEQKSHVYADGVRSHDVIVSGVISDVTITTNMQEVCRKLY